MASVRVGVVALFLDLMLLTSLSQVTSSATPIGMHVESNDNSLKIYVVALEGVATSCVENLSEVVDGVIEAAALNKTSVLLGFAGLGGLNFREVEFDAICTVITDWAGYELLVEFSSDVIVINAHGAYLPVPRGYSKDDWVGKIAYAMLNRQVTWVHLSGYPFYYVQHQGGDVEKWGEDGFQELMTYIGRGDVDCHIPVQDLSFAISGWGSQSLRDWRRVDDVYAKSVTPVKASDFNELLILGVYTISLAPERFYSGAVIRFSLTKDASDYGFYVHLGAGEFTDVDRNEVDAPDFYMGYVATAAAIWCEVGFSTVLLFAKVPRDIARAKAAERTQGLDEAESLLVQAVNAYQEGKFKTAIALAYQAQEVVANATRPPDYLALYGPYAFMISIVAVGAFLIVQGRRRETKMTSLGFVKCPICSEYIAKDEIQEHENLCLRTRRKKW